MHFFYTFSPVFVMFF